MINSKSAWDQLQNTPKNVPNILAAHRVVTTNQPFPIRFSLIGVNKKSFHAWKMVEF